MALDYTSGQASLLNYMHANPINDTTDYGQPLEYRAGTAQSADVDRQSNEQYQGWWNTLSPEDRQSYTTSQNEHYNKGRNLSRMAFGAAATGIGLAGAAGAGMFGAGLGSGAAAPTSIAGNDIALGYGGTAGLGGAAGTGAATAGASSSPWTSFLNGLTSSAGSAIGKTAIGVGGNLLNSLITGGAGAIAGQKATHQYGDVINEINTLYGPDSAYSKQMQQALARKDSAAGRNSQYGDRAVQLAAALTQAKSNALTSPGYGALLGNRVTSQNQLPATLIALLQSREGQDLITKAGGNITDLLQKYFTNSGEPAQAASPNGSWMDSGDFWNTPQAGV